MSTKRAGSRIPSASSHRNDNASTLTTNDSTTGSRQRQNKRDEVCESLVNWNRQTQRFL
jgi:hypothetical protein